jgi:alkylation response protein AidB-like acyl-CoA dehydrogenase
MQSTDPGSTAHARSPGQPAVDVAKAMLWATEVQHRVLDRYLQLFGGCGYMTEYPIARVRRRPGADYARRHVADHEGDHRPRRDRATA